MQDLIIIGGGPAGLSAALTARNRNKSVLVITGSMADSGLWKAGRITNYPGTPDIPGKELLEQMTQQARDMGVVFLHARVQNAMPMGETIGVAAGSEFEECRALILATGIAQKSVFPGEKEFLGRGVSYCATCDGMLYRGKRTAVIGLSATRRRKRNFCAASAVMCGILRGRSKNLKFAVSRRRTRSSWTARRFRWTRCLCCAAALRRKRSCRALRQTAAMSLWMPRRRRTYRAFLPPATAPARRISFRPRSARGIKRRFLR